MVNRGVQRFHGYGRRVHVSDEVAGVWYAHRQTAPDEAESFGVLMGTTSVDRRDIWIERVTTPMAHDRRTRFSFKLRDPGHQRMVYGMFTSSGGRAIHLGTWHTHPEPVPTPSGIDRNDWGACLRANRGRPLAFVLVGTDKVRVFVRARWQFRPLSEECDNHGCSEGDHPDADPRTTDDGA